MPKRKKFTPETPDGRFVAFRLRKDCPIQIYEKLNEINKSKEILIVEYFTNLMLQDLGIIKNAKKEDVSSIVKELLEKELKNLKLENISSEKIIDEKKDENTIKFDDSPYSSIVEKLKNQNQIDEKDKSKLKIRRSGVWK